MRERKRGRGLERRGRRRRERKHLPGRAARQGGVDHLLVVDAEHVDPSVLP